MLYDPTIPLQVFAAHVTNVLVTCIHENTRSNIFGHRKIWKQPSIQEQEARRVQRCTVIN